jgi:hypothetical protein
MRVLAGETPATRERPRQAPPPRIAGPQPIERSSIGCAYTSGTSTILPSFEPAAKRS